MENIHSKDYLEAMNVKSMKREKVWLIESREK
jgi:hypothetical protein